MTSPNTCTHDARGFRPGDRTFGILPRVRCLSCNDTLATGKVANAMQANNDIEFLWNSVEGRYVEA